MTWQAPYLFELRGPDAQTMASILDDLAQFLRKPTFEFGITVGDGRETYNPTTGVKSRPATGPVPMGIIRQQDLTGPSNGGTAWAADTDTDMTLTNVPVIGGHTYGVHLHTQVEITSVNAPARWDVNLKINGVVSRRFDVLQLGMTTSSTRHTIDSTVYWTPSASATTDDLLVSLDETTDGSTVLFEAGGGHRTLTLTHLGKL